MFLSLWSYVTPVSRRSKTSGFIGVDLLLALSSRLGRIRIQLQSKTNYNTVHLRGCRPGIDYIRTLVRLHEPVVKLASHVNVYLSALRFISEPRFYLFGILHSNTEALLVDMFVQTLQFSL